MSIQGDNIYTGNGQWVRDVDELVDLLRLGKKEIAKACSVSPRTVVEYVRKADAAGLNWPLPGHFLQIIVQIIGTLRLSQYSPKTAFDL